MLAVDDAVELGVLAIDEAVELGVLLVDDAVLELDDVVLAWPLCHMLSHVAHPASAMIAMAIAVLRKPVDSMNISFAIRRGPPDAVALQGRRGGDCVRPLRQSERYEPATAVDSSRWPMLM